MQSLRERFNKDHPKSRVTSNQVPKVGDVVLIKEENASRATWKMGRIQKLIPSQDGQFRSAEVAVPNKKMLKRPINILCPVEINNMQNPF